MADPASTSIESRSDAADRAIAGWEIPSVTSSILMAEWLAAATTGGNRLVVAAPVILALTFILFSHRLHRETLRDLGIRIDNFLRAVKLLLLPMVGVTLLAVVVSF